MRWLCVHMSISSLFDNLGFLQSLSFYCRVCSLFLPAVAFCRKKSGVREDDHIPGLRWVPGTATKCEFLASHRKLLKSQFSSVAQSCPTLRPHELQRTRPPCPSPTPTAYSNSCPLIKSVMPSNHHILCCPLLLLPSIILSIRVFTNESVFRIRWPKYWSFRFSISPSNECNKYNEYKQTL